MKVPHMNNQQRGGGQSTSTTAVRNVADRTTQTAINNMKKW